MNKRTKHILKFSSLVLVICLSISFSIFLYTWINLTIRDLPVVKFLPKPVNYLQITDNHTIRTLVDKIDERLRDRGKQGKKLVIYYYIQEGELEVNKPIGKHKFTCFAASGGGAYSNKLNSVYSEDDKRNHICHLDKVTKFNSNNQLVERGGPIVPGTYTFRSEIAGEVQTRGNGIISDNRYIALEPNTKTQKNICLLDRTGGFRIHCRGGRGSDGCIVPQSAADFKKLLTLIAESSDGKLIVKKSRNGMEYHCGNVVIDNME